MVALEIEEEKVIYTKEVAIDILERLSKAGDDMHSFSILREISLGFESYIHLFLTSPPFVFNLTFTCF